VVAGALPTPAIGQSRDNRQPAPAFVAGVRLTWFQVERPVGTI